MGLPIIMDSRCPLGLKTLPTSTCPLAADSLRLLRNNPGQAEKLKLPCDWYINSRESNNCFFKYMADFDPEERHETIDIAELLLTTQAAVYSGQRRAEQKVREIGIGEMLLDEEED